MAGDLSVKDVHLTTDSAKLDPQRSGAQVVIDELAVKNIDAQLSAPQKQIQIGEFAIRNPKITASVGEKKSSIKIEKKEIRLLK